MSPVTTEFEAALVAADALADAGVAAVKSTGHAIDVLQAAERLVRLAAVARVDALAQVHSSGVYVAHGHAAAHHMARHLGRTSSADAARADKIRRMVARCDDIAAAWRAGDMSVDQAAVLGRAFANPRTRDMFIDSQAWFLDLLNMPFRRFEQGVARWVRLADCDGSEPRAEPAHHNRDVSLIQDHFSLQWTLRGTFGSEQGAELRRVLDAYVSAENLADWTAAREVHGDGVCGDDLARNSGQRRADALAQVFADAVHSPARSVSVDRVHNVVWSEHSLEAMMRRWFGNEPAPIDVDQHRCHSLNGHELDENAAFGDFLVSSWRRVVQGVDGITLDISAKQRFYTGLARLGVVISHDTCFWPGCDVASTQCEIDHRRPWAQGGPTTQHNGAPACHKHNRLKERGYSVTVDDDGTIQVRSRDGELLPQ